MYAIKRMCSRDPYLTEDLKWTPYLAEARKGATKAVLEEFVRTSFSDGHKAIKRGYIQVVKLAPRVREQLAEAQAEARRVRQVVADYRGALGADPSEDDKDVVKRGGDACSAYKNREAIKDSLFADGATKRLTKELVETGAALNAYRKALGANDNESDESVRARFDGYELLRRSFDAMAEQVKSKERECKDQQFKISVLEGTIRLASSGLCRDGEGLSQAIERTVNELLASNKEIVSIASARANAVDEVRALQKRVSQALLVGADIAIGRRLYDAAAEGCWDELPERERVDWDATSLATKLEWILEAVKDREASAPRAAVAKPKPIRLVPFVAMPPSDAAIDPLVESFAVGPATQVEVPKPVAPEPVMPRPAKHTMSPPPPPPTRTHRRRQGRAEDEMLVRGKDPLPAWLDGTAPPALPVTPRVAQPEEA